jgi:hypothetical protein
VYHKVEAPQSILRSCVQGSASAREALGIERQEKILFQGCAAGLRSASSRPLEVLEGSTRPYVLPDSLSAVKRSQLLRPGPAFASAATRDGREAY